MKGFRILSIVLALVTTLFRVAGPQIVSAQEKEEARVENSGIVITEILNIPENIPDNLLARAPCVVVIPSVLKLAFGFGGSFGRGVMTCRGGPDFKGPWSAPTMMALEGGSFGFQGGAQATDFVLLLMNHRSASAVLTSKVKIGCGCIRCCRAGRPHCGSISRCQHASWKSCPTRVLEDYLPAFLWVVPRSARITAPTETCTASK